MADARAYVALVEQHATDGWRGHVVELWRRLTDEYASRLMELNGAKQTTFNRRFVCQVVGGLIAEGVYRANVPQTEYGRLLAHEGKDMRSSVNRGLTDEREVRDRVRQLMADVRRQN